MQISEDTDQHLFDGLKVIDLASFLAGPCAATLLSDFGADVIKVEPPGGDGYRRLHGRYPTDHNWLLTSRGKRDIVLDIGSGDGREVLSKLLEDADVLIVNFRDRQLKKYDLEYETLKARYPRLIVARITGFGSKGPERDRRGYDTTAWWARSGMVQLMKPMGGDPVFPVGGVGDHATGMTLYAAILMALYRRQINGRGGLVETSLLASGVWSNGMSVQAAIAGNDIEAKIQKYGTRSPFFSVYQTRDKKHIVLMLTNAKVEWPQLSDALGHREWLEDDRFKDVQAIMGNMLAFRDLLIKAFSASDLDSIVEALDGYQLTYGIAKGPMELIDDRHLLESGILVDTEHHDPKFQKTITAPIQIDGQDQKHPFNAPGYGEHTQEILEQLGYRAETIEQLLNDNCVHGPSGSKSHDW